MDLHALIIDDQSSILESMEMFFRLRGWKVSTANNGLEGLDLAERLVPFLVILDIRLPDLGGLDVLKALRERCPETHIVMITAYQDMETTIQAIKLGAFDYLHKPIDIKEMDAVIRRLEQDAVDEISVEGGLSNQADSDSLSMSKIVGKSRSMKEVFKAIARLSESRITTLIQGESGTGKELIARAIHRNSSFRNKPFNVMDCSTFVDSLIESELFGYEKGAFTGATETRKGRLELTGDGTVFFDEIGDLPLHLQSKLLRFLQEREFVRVGGSSSIHSNSRVIAATHRNLMEMVHLRKFRQDLYFRLSVAAIEVPPLRERRSDILLLATFFLRKINAQTGFPLKSLSRDAIQHLMDYDWPGNVRELENTLNSAVIMSNTNTLTSNDIASSLQKFSKEMAKLQHDLLTLEDVERSHVLRVLERCKWHFGKTCEVLAISRPTLRAKIKKYDLSPNSQKTGNGGIIK